MEPTRREQAIERIALAIARAMDYRAGQGRRFELEDARRVNADSGWTFDIRWDDGNGQARRLVTERGWRLSEQDLGRAFARARQLRAAEPET